MRVFLALAAGAFVLAGCMTPRATLIKEPGVSCLDSRSRDTKITIGGGRVSADVVCSRPRPQQN